MRYGRSRRRKFKINFPRFRINKQRKKINLFKNKNINVNCRNYKCKSNSLLPNNIMSIIGWSIVLIGVLLVFKNTTIYSGTGFSRGITIGTPCGLQFLILVIGLIFILYNYKSFLGWTLVSIGAIWFVIAIIVNLKMMFMPINLLKAILIFGFIAFGISILFRNLIRNIR